MKGANMLNPVTKNTSAEELIKSSPQVLNYLVSKGVCGIRLGFPVKGTIEQIAKEEDFSDFEIENTLIGLNKLITHL